MSGVSSSWLRLKKAVASEKPGDWGPITAVVFGFLAYKVPEWIIFNLAPFIVLLLPQDDNVRNFVFYALFEALTIGAIFMLLVWFNRKFSDIGLGKFKPNYIVWTALGFFAYMVITISARTIADGFVQIPDEAQQIGFVDPNGLELVLAFITLVIVVPVAEELIFRGFMFKGIRKGFNFAITAVVVSLMFAVAHGQINVGLDVFCLSLVLCYMREKTGSLWPGIMLHAVKNAIAFTVIFIIGA